MTADHWFDTLNKALVRPASRRAVLYQAVAGAIGFGLGADSAADAAKKRKKKGKSKSKGKGKKKGKGKNKPNQNPGQTCSRGACDRAYRNSQSERGYCEFICRQCDGNDPRQFCILGDPDIPLSASCCAEGLDCCSGQCVNTFDDDNHCGACDNRCSPGKLCFGGDCVCQEGLTLCDDICRDTNRDADHCGGCNQQCAGEGMECCDGQCVDTNFDENHCGGCNLQLPDGYGCCGRVSTGAWVCSPNYYCAGLHQCLPDQS